MNQVTALTRTARLAERLLLVMVALLPLAGAVYLHIYEVGARVEESPRFHELAIAISVLASTAVAYVAYRCYQLSGEVFVGWLALALVGETLVYLPHGLFTVVSHTHMPLFLIYGPASRLVMAVLLLAGLFRYDAAPRPVHERTGNWTQSIIAFLVIDVGLAWAALRHPGFMSVLRLIFEFGALACTLVALATMLVKPRGSPLMTLYTYALAGFATSSATFVLAGPWSHLWWYAHLVFMAAFLLLTYGVLKAFQATGSFSGVFSQAQLMAHLRDEKTKAEQIARDLQIANARLEVIATTDALTDVANRRHFMERAVEEQRRRERMRTPLSVLLLDLDFFKVINDTFGHHRGDEVLRAFTVTAASVLRSIDLIGRLGGEEFAVLMPSADPDAAQFVAQRLRAAVKEIAVKGDNGRPIAVSVSIGVASFGADGQTITDVLRAADRRLYEAKRSGRDRVVAHDGPARVVTQAVQGS